MKLDTKDIAKLIFPDSITNRDKLNVCIGSLFEAASTGMNLEYNVLLNKVGTLSFNEHMYDYTVNLEQNREYYNKHIATIENEEERKLVHKKFNRDRHINVVTRKRQARTIMSKCRDIVNKHWVQYSRLLRSKGMTRNQVLLVSIIIQTYKFEWYGETEHIPTI